MTVVATGSAIAAGLEALLGLLCLAFATAPGWRRMRSFAWIAFTAAIYSLVDLPQTLSTSPELLVWSARASVTAVGLHIAGWLVQSQEGRTPGPLRRGDRLLLGLLLLLAGLGLVPGLALDDQVRTLPVPWLGVDYRLASPTSFTPLLFLAYPGVMVVPLARYLRRALAGEPGARAQLFGLSLVLVVGVSEALVASGLLVAPLGLEWAMLVGVLTVVGDMTRQVVTEARSLAAASERLRQEVARARQELGETQARLAIGQLSAGVAHEINSPLATILANLETGQQMFAAGRPAPEYLPLMAEAEEAAERIRRIVLDLGLQASSGERAAGRDELPSALAGPATPSPRVPTPPGILAPAPPPLPPPGPPPPSSSPDAPDSVGPARPAGALRVLCVDDDALLLRSVRRFLRGLDVVMVGSGAEALQLIEQGQPIDVVVCDLMMGGLTGQDVHERLAARGHELADRFLIITGGPTTERARRFIDSKKVPVLFKPFSREQLLRQVEKLAQARRPGSGS